MSSTSEKYFSSSEVHLLTSTLESIFVTLRLPYGRKAQLSTPLGVKRTASRIETEKIVVIDCGSDQTVKRRSLGTSGLRKRLLSLETLS